MDNLKQNYCAKEKVGELADFFKKSRSNPVKIAQILADSNVKCNTCNR